MGVIASLCAACLPRVRVRSPVHVCNIEESTETIFFGGGLQMITWTRYGLQRDEKDRDHAGFLQDARVRLGLLVLGSQQLRKSSRFVVLFRSRVSVLYICRSVFSNNHSTNRPPYSHLYTGVSLFVSRKLFCEEVLCFIVASMKAFQNGVRLLSSPVCRGA